MCLWALTWSSSRPVARNASNWARISCASWRRISRQAEKANAGARHVAVERAVSADQARDRRRRRHRASVDQHEMQPDMQAGKPARPHHRVRRRRRADHQARGRQNTVPVRLLDRRVDRRVEPEIVGADDQALHGGCSARVARKLRRRTHRSGLRRRLPASPLSRGDAEAQRASAHDGSEYMGRRLDFSRPFPGGAGNGRIRRLRAGGGASFAGS